MKEKIIEESWNYLKDNVNLITSCSHCKNEIITALKMVKQKTKTETIKEIKSIINQTTINKKTKRILFEQFDKIKR